jgi:hypothetical protein
MCLTATISVAPMIPIAAQAEARSRFGACGSASANSIEKKSVRTYVAERTETVQGKNVHRFIAKSAFGRFWRSGIAVFLETATRCLNSEIRRFISFRR